MIPLIYQHAKPLFKDTTRLTMLKHLDFGLPISEEHMTERLNKFIEVLPNDDSYKVKNKIRSSAIGKLGEPITIERANQIDDLLWYGQDTFRHSKEISERYRKGKMELHDMSLINDPNVKVHWSIATGYEKHLIKTILNLDSEYLNRLSIVPILNDK